MWGELPSQDYGARVLKTECMTDGTGRHKGQKVFPRALDKAEWEIR